jgi:hypothetical protein
VWGLVFQQASHAVTRSQNSVLCHDLCCGTYEPQLCYTHADAAADNADMFIAFQIILVLFLEFSSVVVISSGFYSGARGFFVYLYCKVKGKGKVYPLSDHEGLDVLYAFV